MTESDQVNVDTQTITLSIKNKNAERIRNLQKIRPSWFLESYLLLAANEVENVSRFERQLASFILFTNHLRAGWIFLALCALINFVALYANIPGLTTTINVMAFFCCVAYFGLFFYSQGIYSVYAKSATNFSNIPANVYAIIIPSIVFAGSCLMLARDHPDLFVGGPISDGNVLLFVLDTGLRGLIFDVVEHWQIKIGSLTLNYNNWWFVLYAFIFRAYCGLLGIRAILSLVKSYRRHRVKRPTQ